VAAANVPRLANTDFRHVTDMCKRLINDSNINVVISVLKILGALAKGLRKHFAPYAKMFFPYIINKFKDKKTLLLEGTNTCLDEFYFCMAIEDVVEDTKEGLADKNPGEKIQLMNWIDRAVERKAKDRAFQDKGKEALKQLFPSFEKLCNDGAVEVR
jgi:cytoskeleton-associated protein 5